MSAVVTINIPCISSWITNPVPVVVKFAVPDKPQTVPLANLIYMLENLYKLQYFCLNW